MALGTQFLDLITRVRAEVRRSVEPSVGVDDLENIKQVINRVLRTLYMAHDWAHLRKVFPRVKLNANHCFYRESLLIKNFSNCISLRLFLETERL